MTITQSRIWIGFLFFLFLSLWAKAAEIDTNQAHFATPTPPWLTSARVNQAVDPVQRFLEWDIRKVTIYWYTDPVAFQKVHGFDSSVLAFARRQDNSIHVGPRVDVVTFGGVFGHEMAHIILFQKFKDAVPKWLEEGLANYAGKHGSVDY